MSGKTCVLLFSLLCILSAQANAVSKQYASSSIPFEAVATKRTVDKSQSNNDDEQNPKSSYGTEGLHSSGISTVKPATEPQKPESTKPVTAPKTKRRPTKSATPPRSKRGPTKRTTTSKTEGKSTKPATAAKTRGKYETPDIPDFTAIQDYTEPFKRQYEGTNGKVVVEILQNGAMQVDWHFDDVDVKLTRWTNEELQQNWKFADGTKVEIKHDSNGNISQYWNMAGKKFKYYEKVEGSITASGNATDEERVKYETEIKLWCHENRHLFPSQFCIVYDRRSIISTKPSVQKDKVVESDQKYRIPALKNFTRIENSKVPYKHRFTGNNYDIVLEIEKNGAPTLDWKKGNTQVNIYTLQNNKIAQSWKFGKNHIFITYYENGVRDQTWKIGETIYRFVEAPGAEIIPSGDFPPGYIIQYKSEIDSWCKENYRFIQEEYCVIYDKRSTQPTQPTTATTAEDSFQTPQIDDFESLEKMRGPFKRVYQGQDGTVELERWENENLALQWSFGKTIANLTTYYNVKIEQLWKFGDALITITKYADGSIDQYWDLSDYYYEFHQTSQGQKTTSGTASEAKVGEFENKIKTWCETNQHIYPLPQCIIYERR